MSPPQPDPAAAQGPAMPARPRAAIRRFLRSLLQAALRVTAPSPSLVLPEARRRARMLASLLLFLVTAAAVLMWLLPWIVAPAEHAANLVLATMGIGVVAAGLGIYAVSRSRHYETAVGLAVAATLIAVTASSFAAEGTIWFAGAPFFLALALILAAALLPLRATLVVCGLTLNLPVVLHFALASFSTALLAVSITFLAMTVAVILLAALMHHLDLEQIHAQARQLRESEERYRALFDASFEGIALHENGRIVDASNALLALLGVEREKVVGTALASLVGDDAREHVRRVVESAPFRAQEATLRRSDGTLLPVEFITKPYLHRGRLVQATAFRDIVMRKEHESARERTRMLEEANERLLEIERLKTRILNVTSHEINTPMTPIRLQVHLLKRESLGGLNAKQLEAVRLLDRNVERLGVLVKDLLDVSRLESGRLHITPEPVELADATRDAVAAFVAAAEESRVALDCVAEGPLWVHADPVRIHQVLTNLISNALKFTPAGGSVAVHVGEDETHERARVTVRDTGAGLDAAQRARLFQPFEQVHEGLARGGSGLGLFISREIVASHGGSLHATSPGPGHGCTFTLELPVHHADADHPQSPPAEGPTRPGDPHREASSNRARRGESR